MANTRISNLTASASNLAASDLVPVVQTPDVGPVKMTGTQIAAGLLSATTPIGSGPILARDASNTLALKNAGNAQIFRVYSTTASSGSYGIISAGVQPDGSTTQADTLYIGSAGTGAAMTKLALVVNGTTRLNLSATTAAFTADITTTGYVKADGANGFCAGASSYIFWNGRVQLSSPAANVLLVEATSGDLITKFGGTTSSFPALKRISSGNCLQVIAADNTASAGFIVGNQALATTATDGFLYIPTCAGTPTGVPTTQTGTAPLVVDSTNNKLYVYVGGAWTAMN